MKIRYKCAEIILKDTYLKLKMQIFVCLKTRDILEKIQKDQSSRR